MKTKLSAQIVEELQCIATEEKRQVFQRFFKTGKGQYGEGDVFLGVMVPDVRRVVKAHAKATTMRDIAALLSSKYHEVRLCSLLIMVQKFSKATPIERKKMFDFYLANTAKINNWDLIDLSAPHIIGAYLLDKPRNVLYELAESAWLWDNRIAIVSTFALIRNCETDETYSLAIKLMRHQHDLIHKAVGWMLREAGKRVSQRQLYDFVEEHRTEMPRTMLRYAIEKFSSEERKHLMRR